MISLKVLPAHSDVLGIPGKGVHHKICERFQPYYHISQYNSLATWMKLGGISHNVSTLLHSEHTFCDCRAIQGYAQTSSDAQRCIYGIVIPASCHPSKSIKGGLAFD